MKIKNTVKICALALMFSATSCADWLAVDLEDSILEDKLYETNDGFLASLNGIYSKLNENYASTLSMGTIDVMAQYYNVAKNSNHGSYSYATYDYDQFKSTSNSIWTNQYSLIANINTLLEHCDATGSALSTKYYAYVKGEALALRAFLHFDLLRMYGPIYSESTSGTSAIPYQETSLKDIQPILSAGEVMNKVLTDLKAASELLKDDRIRENGVMNGESDDPNEDTSLRYRQYRMNYYTVNALLARAYLWMGDKTSAYNTAKAIISENEEKAVFPWTSRSAVEASSNPNLIFSTEVMFALYNTSRTQLYDRLFNPSVDMNTILTFKGESTEDGDYESKLTYFYDDLGDVRRTSLWEVNEIKSSSDGGVTSTSNMLTFKKYTEVTTSAYRYMIPLVRLSEVYLIAAECATSVEEALTYVNAIRNARNCVRLEQTDDLDSAKMEDYISREFAREVIGEGQLFFFYKRKAMNSIMSGTDFGSKSYWDPTPTAKEGKYSMDLQDYVWPLPEVETNQRVNK